MSHNPHPACTSCPSTSSIVWHTINKSTTTSTITQLTSPPPLVPPPPQGASLSDTELAESGIGLIIAGNDTSGLGVTALLAVLPLFPEVMDKLRQEQKQVGFWMGSLQGFHGFGGLLGVFTHSFFPS